MYRILIVEDEADAAAALRDAIRRYGDEHAEQFQVGWMRNTIDIDEPAFDLIFMDIDLGIENGMEAAREIREFDRSTPIIFVTNLAQYAVQGYEVNALDFIVKPFTYGSFSLRMDRAMEVLRRREGRSITVQTRDGLRIFPASSLVRVWMRGHNVNYGLSDSSTAAARGSLKETEEMLGGTPFLKISSDASSTWHTSAGCATPQSRCPTAPCATSAAPTSDAAWRKSRDTWAEGRHEPA